MRRRIPITILLASAVTLPALLVATILFAVSFLVAELNTSELTRDKVELLLDSLVRRVENHLRPATNIADWLDSEVSEAVTAEEAAERDGLVMDALRIALAAYPQVSGVAFIRPEGDIYRITRAPSQETRLQTKPDDPRLVEFLKDGQTREDGYWGEFVQAEEGNAPLINYRQPVRVGDRFLGVIAVGVSVTELSVFLDSLQSGPGSHSLGTPFILSGKDHVVAHPLMQWDYAELTRDHPLPSVLAFPDPTLSRLFGEGTQSPPERYLGNFQVRIFDIAGISYFGYYRTLEGFSEKPMTLGAILQASEVNQQITRLWQLAAVAGFLLLLTLAGGLLLGRYLSRPIKELRRGARRVAALELEGHPGFGRSPVRELDEAARAFDAMLGALKLFAHYVPRSLVQRLMKAGLGAGVEPEERELALMFTDIVGFTSLSEKAAAKKVSEALNHHFEILGTCVEREGGTIDKYIGDALMAFWGAPEPQEDAEERAARAALAIAEAIGRDNDARRAEGRRPVMMRIGLHRGPVVVGNIGSPERVNYTVIGDSVNLCQRLEALGKELASEGEAREVEILISEDLRRRLGAGFVCEEVGEQSLRGRSGSIRVFRLLAGPEA
jgi:class 3 adenylate cyclase